uniref:protein-tyrosine-phosphatase n=1 Tax=Varanus komodoensis TaxID=61221 RepID=A0A8D2ISM1_VARKO
HGRAQRLFQLPQLLRGAVPLQDHASLHRRLFWVQETPFPLSSLLPRLGWPTKPCRRSSRHCSTGRRDGPLALPQARLLWPQGPRGPSLSPCCLCPPDAVKSSGGRVLLHCQAGVSRSATICLAYLIQSRRVRLEEAFDFVKQRRGVISPNFGFMGQLLQFETEVLCH